MAFFPRLPCFVAVVSVLMCIFVFAMSQDAHNCILEFDEDTAMFSVYDGHGGNTDTYSLKFTQ